MNKIKLNSLDIELILAHVLKKTREYIIAHPEYKLTKSQIAKCKLLIKKRVNSLPIAYITGEKEFYGLKFKINKNVLIPRPETELMVEEALKLVASNPQPTTIIDMGTGSGCIIITLAKKIKNCQFFAIDISTKALVIAKQNANLNSVVKKIKFIKSNLLESIINNSKYKLKNSKLIILANLPYLTPTQIKNSPSIKYEPKLALTAGLDGLKYYGRLFQQICALRIARCELRDINILCEIDPSQTVKIKQMVKRELPKATLQIKKDLSGLNRLVIIKIT